MDIKLGLEIALFLACIGAVLGVAMARASRRPTAEVDERVSRVLGALPGANCGACGNTTCFTTAEAIVGGRMPADGCAAGGDDVADEVARIMGADRVPAQPDDGVPKAGVA